MTETKDGGISTTEVVKVLEEPRKATIEGERPPRRFTHWERRQVRGLDEEVLLDVRGRCKDIIFHLKERLAKEKMPEERKIQLQRDIDILTAVGSLSPSEKNPNAILLTIAGGERLRQILEEEQEELWEPTVGTEEVRIQRVEFLELEAKAKKIETLAELKEEDAEKDPSLLQEAIQLRSEARKAREEVKKKAREIRILEIKQATDTEVQLAGEVKNSENELLEKEKELKKASSDEERKEKERQKEEAKRILDQKRQQLIQASSLVKQLQAAERRRRLIEDDLEVLAQEIESLKKTLFENRFKLEIAFDRLFGRKGLVQKEIRDRNLATTIVIEEILRNPVAFLEMELDLRATRERITKGEQPEEVKESPPAKEEIATAKRNLESLSSEEINELIQDLNQGEALSEEKKSKWAERLGVSVGIIGLILALISQILTTAAKEIQK